MVGVAVPMMGVRRGGRGRRAAAGRLAVKRVQPRQEQVGEHPEHGREDGRPRGEAAPRRCACGVGHEQMQQSCTRSMAAPERVVKPRCQSPYRSTRIASASVVIPRAIFSRASSIIVRIPAARADWASVTASVFLMVMTRSSSVMRMISKTPIRP